MIYACHRKPWNLLLCINLIKWPFCLQMLPLNAHQQSICFENSPVFHFVVISYEMSINTICNALTPAIHSVNKQYINERHSKLMFFQCSQHETFYSYSVQCPYYFVHPLYNLLTATIGKGTAIKRDRTAKLRPLGV